MAERDEMTSMELMIPTSLFDKLEALRQKGGRDQYPFYRDAIVRGSLVNRFEEQGLFVLAVDEERSTETFLDSVQEQFENAESSREAVRSVGPKILDFPQRTE